MFNEIENGTDFFRIISPDFKESKYASTDALEQLEKVLRNPNLYRYYFGTKNILEKWKSKDYQDCILFREKYTYDFEQFCIKNNFAHECYEGIQVPKELVFIYMGQLSSVISDIRGLEAITDYSELDNLNIFVRRTTYSAKRKITLARSTINLHLPKKLEEIKFQDIIRLRNNRNYNATLEAFHYHLDKYLASLASDASGNSIDFKDSLNYSLKNLGCELLKLTPEIVSFIVGVWSLINSANKDYLNILGNTLTFGSIGATTVQITSEWKNSKTNRFAKKYLASLRRLNSL